MFRFVSPVLGLAACAVVCQASLDAAEPVAVGEEAPDFKAVSVDGAELTLKSFRSADILVVCFTCNGCPVANAYEDRFAEFAAEYKIKGVEFVAINCDFNEIQKGAAKEAAAKELEYPYLVDESGKSARAYGATVTPQLFVLDKDRKVAFTGPFDDDMSSPKSHFVRDAVESLLSGQAPVITSKRPFGCRIKLKR